MEKSEHPIEVAVVIPARNEAEHLKSCLKSIERTMPTGLYEIIVVDNNSQDATREIALASNCTVVQNPKQGAALSRNLGASLVEARFLAFIDADCMLNENWFKYMKEHFNDPDVVSVGTKVSPDFKNATWVEKTVFLLNQRRGNATNYEKVLEVKWIGSSNILIKKAAFDSVGGFDENLITCEDYDLSERLQHIGKILLDKRIYTIHMGEDKTLKTLFLKEMWRGQDSLKHWSKHAYNLYEAPSILLPVLFLFCSLLGTISLIFGMKSSILLPFAFFLPFIMVMRSREIIFRPFLFFQGLLVSSTYLLARGMALIVELFTLMTSKKNSIVL